MGCYDVDTWIKKMEVIMNGQPWCECVHSWESQRFTCSDCEQAYLIINDFIRSEVFKEWLKAREDIYYV